MTFPTGLVSFFNIVLNQIGFDVRKFKEMSNGWQGRECDSEPFTVKYDEQLPVYHLFNDTQKVRAFIDWLSCEIRKPIDITRPKYYDKHSIEFTIFSVA